MLIFHGKNKACLVVVDLTNGLTILTVLTIRLATNFQTNMESQRIVLNRNTRYRIAADNYVL